MDRGIYWVALAALLLLSVAPSASGSHCETKINVYGRVSPAPLAPPPYSSGTAGMCVRFLSPGGVEEHKLPPNTDQIMVRVHGDYGPAIPTLDVELDGLGFVDIHHTLYRTLNAAGGYSYNLVDWLALPNGAVDGSLTATIRQPEGIYRSITYTTTATFIPPSPPPLPP